MKKLIAFLFLASLTGIAASAQVTTRTVLSTSAKNGNTTTEYVGRVQGDTAEDGTLVLTVFPLIVKTDSAGLVLSSELGTNAAFTITLTPAQFTSLSTLVKAAFTADRAKK